MMHGAAVVVGLRPQLQLMRLVLRGHIDCATPMLRVQVLSGAFVHLHKAPVHTLWDSSVFGFLA